MVDAMRMLGGVDPELRGFLWMEHGCHDWIFLRFDGGDPGATVEGGGGGDVPEGGETGVRLEILKWSGVSVHIVCVVTL